jgi:hypothetical protein
MVRQPSDDENTLCLDCRYPICHNMQPGYECTSKRLGQEPDLRLGDTCVLCCCWDCERCGVLMDLDCEIRVLDNHGGFDAVCEKCVTKEDTRYDEE